MRREVLEKMGMITYCLLFGITANRSSSQGMKSKSHEPVNRVLVSISEQRVFVERSLN